MDYEHCQSAQARFEPPRPLEQARVGRTKEYILLLQARGPEKRSAAQMTSEERFAQSMAESRARAAAKKRLHAQTTGPPTLVQGPGGGDPEGDPLDSDGDDNPLDPDDLGLQDPDNESPHDQVPQTTRDFNEDSFRSAQPMHNALQQDYSH